MVSHGSLLSLSGRAPLSAPVPTHLLSVDLQGHSVKSPSFLVQRVFSRHRVSAGCTHTHTHTHTQSDQHIHCIRQGECRVYTHTHTHTHTDTQTLTHTHTHLLSVDLQGHSVKSPSNLVQRTFSRHRVSTHTHTHTYTYAHAHTHEYCIVMVARDTVMTACVCVCVCVQGDVCADTRVCVDGVDLRARAERLHVGAWDDDMYTDPLSDAFANDGWEHDGTEGGGEEGGGGGGGGVGGWGAGEGEGDAQFKEAMKDL